MAREWMDDLWPTSFKGVPFWVRKADTEFGKRLQEDQYPEQDDPFVQELGAIGASEQVEAYLLGDTSDIDAEAFKATLLGLGAGAYVHPTEGPIDVMFKTGRRSYELDRMGYIGLTLTFVRVASASTAGPSGDQLANLVSDAADGLGGALAALTAQFVLS